MATMILPRERDPRLVTIRRGGTLTDDDHRLLATWAAGCAAHVLPLFERAAPDDDRPRRAIGAAHDWVAGTVRMTDARTAAFAAHAAAREVDGAARLAARAAGQAAAVAHVAAHDLGAAAYAIRAAAQAVLDAEGTARPDREARTRAEAAARTERDWQRAQLPDAVRALVLDDQHRRDGLCWGVFG